MGQIQEFTLKFVVFDQRILGAHLLLFGFKLINFESREVFEGGEDLDTPAREGLQALS